MKKLTQDELKKQLEYNSGTGLFVRKVRNAQSVKIGDVAGCLVGRGYVVIHVFGEGYYAHRLAWLYVNGYFPENEIDHIDRNKSNNSWDNLREVSHICNMRNNKISKLNKSGITGVCWVKKIKKWCANITVDYKTIQLGGFDSKTLAAEARLNAEIKYGFPNCNTTSSAYVYLKKANNEI